MQTHEKRDYERLRAEGRWSQASEFREAERKGLRAADCPAETGAALVADHAAGEAD